MVFFEHRIKMKYGLMDFGAVHKADRIGQAVFQVCPDVKLQPFVFDAQQFLLGFILFHGSSLFVIRYFRIAPPAP